MYSSSINAIIFPFRLDRLPSTKFVNFPNPLNGKSVQQVTERRPVLLVGLLPSPRIPDFESEEVPDQHHLASQVQQFALLIRKHDPSLFISGDMLSLR